MVEAQINQARLEIAVETIWKESGHDAPVGEDLVRAAEILKQALVSGQKIPRQRDKTFQPLYGPRRDIEEQG